MSNARQLLRAVPSVTQTVAPREIAVRFTSTSGLITPVRKPLNSFRWVGPGTLHFSEQGVLVTAKRSTLLGPRQTRRFIPAAEIHDVYREANAVQVHLRGSRSPYFRLWAEDAASAAQIVASLPTLHTIEFESALSEPQIETAPRRPLLWLTALLAVAAIGLFLWLAGNRTNPPKALPVARSIPQPAQMTASAAATHADELLAEQELAQILPGIEALRSEFDIAFEALMSGRVSQQKFADELDQWLIPQWDALEAKALKTNAAPGSLHERADDDLMEAINSWQLGLRTYTEDLRIQRQAVRPFDFLAHAERMQRRAEDMQLELERRPP